MKKELEEQEEKFENLKLLLEIRTSNKAFTNTEKYLDAILDEMNETKKRIEELKKMLNNLPE